MTTVVTFGEVLLRLSAKDSQRLPQSSGFDVHYGGSEANVSSVLSQWGVSSEHVSQLPDNDLGEAAMQSLRKFGVDVSHSTRSPHRMAIYYLEHGKSLRAPKVVYDRFDSAFANLDPASFDWDEILKDARWFHWSGITPAISATAAKACKDAITVARKKGITISGDINYRRVLWEYGKTPLQIMPELIEQCDLLVGGLTDFENSLNIRATGETAFEKVCNEVQKKYPQVKQIANTMRKTHHATHNELQGVLWDGKLLIQSKVYSINPIVDRIGSGDAFMAGLIYKSLTKAAHQEAIDFATAAAAYKHTIPGDVLHASAKEIESIVIEENIGKLLR
jgi:2-dehydro-3-deoxygluconokinase